MMRWTMLVLVAALLAVVPATAQAGGWATVGLSSLPDGTAAGEPWVVELTILQHGRTPLEGVHPRVLLHGPDGARREVAAKPTSKPGVYRASVVFPTAGRWRFAIDDGFLQTHTYAPVTIGSDAGSEAGAGDTGAATPGASAAEHGGGANWLPAAAVVLGAAALFAAVALLSRVSRRAPRAAR